MLLAVDVGNTHIVIGVFENESLVVDWRIATEQKRTSDEYEVLLQNLFKLKDIPVSSIGGIIISSVVPKINHILEQLCRKCFHIEPVFVEPSKNSGMKICCDNPDELGADRIANSVAAFEKYGCGIIVIDFGTATTFDYISPAGEFRGGVIAPGITISGDALFQNASNLPRVEYDCPDRVVACNTVESMQSGIVYGYVSLVEGIVERIKKEIGAELFVIATGGLAPIISKHVKTINAVDEYLTLKGLKVIFDRNKQ